MAKVLVVLPSLGEGVTLKELIPEIRAAVVQRFPSVEVSFLVLDEAVFGHTPTP